MAYKAELGNGQFLFVHNQGAQTLVTLSHQSAGQQQSQTASFETGAWSSPPALYCTATGVILKITAATGDRLIQLQGQQLQSLSTVPALPEHDRVMMQEAADSSIPSLSFLPPLQMGDMAMQMNPMRMQMGDMAMQMPSNPASAEQRFCPQCGNALQPDDRFCPQCGHGLRS
ncbi:MAG: zinc ribbon domain-containing protein [Leptolyngbyaceae cyanobacterium SL_7_1]|nr:zinc ribbon domain-containing protein [Leptolyngbyaceae cyanobacterium SL_7_1]